jgi:hypothetical protein
MLSGVFPAISVVRLFAIVFVAICLVPTGAHLAELPNKMALRPGEYMIVQKIYHGWALFGVFGALVFTLVHTMMVWREPIPGGLSLLSFLALAGTQVIFWTYTYPMSALTQNWTVTPENFHVARQQWEYSHAVNALITLGPTKRPSPRMNSRPLAANCALWIAMMPLTNSRLRRRTPAMSTLQGPRRSPNVEAWRTRPTTFAL